MLLVFYCVLPLPVFSPIKSVSGRSKMADKLLRWINSLRHTQSHQPPAAEHESPEEAVLGALSNGAEVTLG